MFKDFFNRSSKKRKYLTVQDSKQNEVPAGIMTKCPKCKKIMYTKELNENQEKIEKDQQKTDLSEAVVTGTAKLDGVQFGVAVMDARFRMGSMGSVVGEKICRIIDYSTEHRLPFILFSASGGARMQEGIISLMQMGKTSVSLKRHSTGGVSASFASVGDIDLSEPKALIGFAGRRVIEQTINEKLPDDFQTAEFLLEHGQLDKVVHRKEMKETLAQLLKLHQGVNKDA